MQSFLESLSNYIHYKPPSNLTKRFMELRLTHVTSMFSHHIPHVISYANSQPTTHKSMFYSCQHTNFNS